jgi:hypothetical protein
MEKAILKTKAIQAAALAYQNDPELSYRKAASLHKVSTQSVINYCSGKTIPAPDVFVTNQKLSPVEEAVLVEHSFECYKQGFPLTIDNLNDFANELLKNRGSNERVGVNWHLAFFKRHPNVESRYSRPIDKQRVWAENADSWIEWFRRFQTTRAKWGIIDPDIYNMDESGASIGVEQKSKVILPKEEKEAFAKQDGNREWGTMIECIRAIGGEIPPFLIHKGKHILKDLADLIYISRATLACSDNGWSNDEIGCEWLKHFNKHTCAIGSHRLLILDGHGSHATFAFTNYARDNNIVLLYLPPHTTHRLQPLDVGIFGPLAKYYSELVHEESKWKGEGVTKREWIQWIQKARVKANTQSNIASAWGATGLVPFNPDRVLRKLQKPKVCVIQLSIRYIKAKCSEALY